MTNEEILKAAQSSKEDIGEYEKTVVRKSLAYGSAVGVGLCMLMVLLELLILTLQSIAILPRKGTDFSVDDWFMKKPPTSRWLC